jgi:tetratricopeptide (TPR) repeat protein
MPPVQEVKAPNRRLDSWKEIAGFFDRDERTVKRWEKERRLPVHRLPGGSRARVFAFTDELQRWMHSLETAPADAPPDGASPHEESSAETPQVLPEHSAIEADIPAVSSDWRKKWYTAAACLALAVMAVVIMVVTHHGHAVALTKRNTPAAADVDPGSSHPPDAQAEEFYLQGRYYWNKRTPEDLQKAVDYFTQAIVRDPGYSKAYVGLADSYNLLREFAAMPEPEAYTRALAAAQKAVQLDDNSAEAHTSLAFVLAYWKWDIAGAEREFRRAIQLNPDYGTAHHWYANFLVMIGRSADALKEINRAEQLDPGSNAVLADKALVLSILGRLDDAIALAKQVEASQPNFLSAHRYLSYFYQSKGDYKDYADESMKAAVMTHDEAQIEITRAAEQGFNAGGEHGALTNTLQVERRLYQGRLISPFLLAVACARLGEKQQALQYLLAAYQEHDPLFLSIRVNQSLAPLHNDPVYRKLLAEAGLPPIS